MIARLRSTPGLLEDNEYTHALRNNPARAMRGSRNAKTARTWSFITTDICSCQKRYAGITTSIMSVIASVATMNA
jgi:hypothetical protein